MTKQFKLTTRQQELMDLSIHNAERRAEFQTGYIPLNETWRGWLQELADRDGYEPAERRMWRQLLAKFEKALAD